MNDRFNQLIQYGTSGIGCWISFIMVAFILATFGLGWLINGFLIFLAVLFVTPVIAFWGFQWWLRRKLIQDKCPVCSYEFTGFKNTEFQCPSCGEVLQVEAEHFRKMTPPGTIDIDAVEVPVQRIEEEN